MCSFIYLSIESYYQDSDAIGCEAKRKNLSFISTGEVPDNVVGHWRAVRELVK